MLIELGNHCQLHNAIDDRPKVTTIHIPEYDETGLGGYTHKAGGIKAGEFRAHLEDALLNRDGITRLPDHEILLSVTQAWPHHVKAEKGPARLLISGKPAEGQPDLRPAWVRVRCHEDVHGVQPDLGVNEDGSKPFRIAPHDAKVAADIEAVLREFYELDDSAVKPPDFEDRYWTRFGAPGEYLRALPDATMLFTDDGRTQQAINYGGGQVGATGAATGSGATTLTNSGASWTSNQWAGYRVIAQSSTSNMVWGNVVSNTTTALTVDRWYAVATPGGSAGSTPTTTSPYMIADGGMLSAWFGGLSTNASLSPAHGDHNLSTEYTAAGGGMIRKIAPYALTSGVSPMGLTLTPVYTSNGSDTFPSTFYGIAWFTSMVVAFSQAGGPMKFETLLNASATIATAGDQITVTESEAGS